MGRVLSGHGLGLAYLNDFAEIAALDQEQIFEELAGSGFDALVFRPERWRLIDHDHLVLARTIDAERHIGLFAASEGHTGSEAFLHIDTAFVVPAARQLRLFQRMLAVAILRIDGADSAPTVISACSSSESCQAALREFADLCLGAKLYPEPETSVVCLGSAALARRVARQIAPRVPLDLRTGRLSSAREQVLTVLDLRGCLPDAVVEAARLLCRARPARAAIRRLAGEPAPRGLKQATEGR